MSYCPNSRHAVMEDVDRFDGWAFQDRAGGKDAVDRILVVDDNLSTLHHIHALLSGPYSIMLAKSGEQALSMALKRPPDLVLLDIGMPGMDGFELLARLKQDTRMAHVPVIFLTAHHEPEMEVQALEAGAQDFLAKPFEKGVLLHRINLYLRLSHYQRHLLQTVRELESSITISFAELIECRDENTGGHVQRTSEYVALLGQALQKREYFTDELHERELEFMVRAAPLHDIGKVGVSDSILLKPGKLDTDEFEAMKRHTRIGARILHRMYSRAKTRQYLLYARMIAQSHHERYDGKGYPHGLRGDEIPLCARIMAVADVYDALVADRVYRKALSHEEACAILVSGRGAQFDPRIVDVFLANQHVFLERRNRPLPTLASLLSELRGNGLLRL